MFWFLLLSKNILLVAEWRIHHITVRITDLQLGRALQSLADRQRLEVCVLASPDKVQVSGAVLNPASHLARHLILVLVIIVSVSIPLPHIASWTLMVQPSLIIRLAPHSTSQTVSASALQTNSFLSPGLQYSPPLSSTQTSLPTSLTLPLLLV